MTIELTENLKTPDEVAARLRVKPRTLQDWRSRGVGPQFVRVGSKIMYPEPAITRWLATRVSGPQIE